MKTLGIMKKRYSILNIIECAVPFDLAFQFSAPYGLRELFNYFAASSASALYLEDTYVTALGSEITCAFMESG